MTIALFKDGERYLSDVAFPWPASPGDATFDVSFSSDKQAGDNEAGAAFFGTFFSGAAVDKNGNPVAPGTVVEAYIGDTLCGVSSVPPVQMVFAQTQGYMLEVVSPDARAGCTKDGVVTFRLNGQEVEGTGVNDLSQQREQRIDLQLN